MYEIGVSEGCEGEDELEECKHVSSIIGFVIYFFGISIHLMNQNNNNSTCTKMYDHKSALLYVDRIQKS